MHECSISMHADLGRIHLRGRLAPISVAVHPHCPWLAVENGKAFHGLDSSVQGVGLLRIVAKY